VTVGRWWRSGPTLLRRRRRLLLFSAPFALIIVVVIVKAVAVVVAGDIAVSAYADRDSRKLDTAVGSLSVLNVIEPAKASLAAGALAVLDNHLEEADRQFTQSLVRSDSCTARVNLELVRETLGNRAAARLDGPTAVAQYVRARTIVVQAQQGCFAGNTDSNQERQLLRNDALPRLDRKIDAARAAPPPPPPPPRAAAAPAPPPESIPAPTDRDTQLRLNPGAGPPMDRLQQILRDAAPQGGD
jgi:hypothetical protein